ncbi:helicase-associated domain-containing protein [Paenibacillus xerothermodurans]|uniref:Helicase XPB/Ssl2 N-terminal domain-containing protein n=1 Tax=Paenibacillus xerothermodurans TaxID=1977292 RepID=A0A2W1P647_PAEXE|nr:helicase-associated domain-containing protein [Paenibacillus xerothermodurans]PZE22538.1 hypothetical protein CBW46_001790 [Paenibacillus xerothermodurans]
MNHTFYFGKMPQELRRTIEAQPAYAAWLDRGRTLLSIWSDRTIMAGIYEQMTPTEKSVLHIVVGSIGTEPFDWIRLEKLTSSVMSGAEAKVGFLLLLRKGLIYMFRKSWGEHVYALAEDALVLWQEILFQAELSDCLPADCAGVEPVDSRFSSLASLIFDTLVFIGQQELRLTKNGTLHKKQLVKWEQITDLTAESFSGLNLKYAHPEVYPVQLAVMMEFLHKLRLVEQHEDMLCLSAPGLHSWLALSEHEQSRRLYAIWRTAVWPGPAWLQHAAILLERQPPDRWFTVMSVLNWLRAQGMLSAFGDLSETALGVRIEQEWMAPLLAFGFIEQGRDDTTAGAALYRWCSHPVWAVEEPAGDSRFYVQPDFEVLLPPAVSHAVRWELAVIAQKLKCDQVSVYKLTKESIQCGLEHGRRLEDTLLFLERHAMYGIPENVRHTLEQWAKPFGKVQLAQVLLLRCQDDDVAEAIGKLPDVESCLIERLGPRAWIIRAEQLKLLAAQLEKAGWMPGKMTLLDSGGGLSVNTSRQESGGFSLDTSRQDGGGKPLFPMALPPSGTAGPAVAGGDRLFTAAPGFIFSRHALVHLDMETKVPEIRDLYPGLHQLPQSWLKDYRRYHDSTRREIVEKALEWQAALQVRHSGRDQVIAPRKLQDTRGTWSVTGLERSQLEEVCLFPNDWQEMKIILPGINENN